MPRAVALLTDFGLADAYVGIMKGVLVRRAPGVTFFDLTHQVPPQALLAGALQLLSAVEYCPEETVFLAVVDPGVGSTRRPLCLRSGGRFFVGPDNGLLWPAAARVGTPEAFHLDRPEYWLPHPGATFHGRDIFAPCAAALAAGLPPEQLGTAITDPCILELPRPTRSECALHGQVLYVDHFGNAVTNLTPADLGHPEPNSIAFHVAGRTLSGPATHYGAVAAGEPLVLLGSLGFYEVAINQGSASQALSLGVSSLLQVGPGPG